MSGSEPWGQSKTLSLTELDHSAHTSNLVRQRGQVDFPSDWSDSAATPAAGPLLEIRVRELEAVLAAHPENIRTLESLVSTLEGKLSAIQSSSPTLWERHRALVLGAAAGGLAGLIVATLFTGALLALARAVL